MAWLRLAGYGLLAGLLSLLASPVLSYIPAPPKDPVAANKDSGFTWRNNGKWPWPGVTDATKHGPDEVPFGSITSSWGTPTNVGHWVGSQGGKNPRDDYGPASTPMRGLRAKSTR